MMKEMSKYVIPFFKIIEEKYLSKESAFYLPGKRCLLPINP